MEFGTHERQEGMPVKSVLNRVLASVAAALAVIAIGWSLHAMTGMLLEPFEPVEVVAPQAERIRLISPVCLHYPSGGRSTPVATRLKPGSSKVILTGHAVSVSANAIGPCAGRQELVLAPLTPVLAFEHGPGDGRRKLIRLKAPVRARVVGMVEVTGGPTPGRYRWVQLPDRRHCLVAPR